jgi:hypothetical protein
MTLLDGFPNNLKWSESFEDLKHSTFSTITNFICLFNTRLIYVPINDEDKVKIGLVPALIKQMVKQVRKINIY